MKCETNPISDDEWLLRRVRREQFRTSAVPVISPNAFELRVRGRHPDYDGISLYRAACLADPCEVLQTISAERQDEYGIVRISVRFLHELKLSVQSRPAQAVKGHVVIPVLNARD